MAEEEHVNWNVDLEVSLFHAIHAHRPIGINRHFQMVFLHDKFNSAVDKKVSAKHIWLHLKKMYDLAALNDSDGLPFPNKECDFSLPDDVNEELGSKPFPRYTPCVDSKTSETENRRESVKEQITLPDTPSSKDTFEPKVSASASRSGKSGSSQSSDAGSKIDDIAKGESSIDSPKPDPRKRTRQSLQSPQTDSASTPSSAKRARRI